MKRSGRQPGPIPSTAAAICLLLAATANACAPVDPAEPSARPEDALRFVGDWPPGPAPAAVVRRALQGCINDVGHAPIVATEDRGFGASFVLFGDATTAGICEVRREANGNLIDVRGGSGGSMLGRGADIRVVSLDLQPERSYLMGVTPVGTAQVRAVVGSHAVDATVGGDLFIVAWPNGVRPRLVVALDRAGREIARLDGEVLATLFGTDCVAMQAVPCPP
jgi:hypothetical protein